MKAHTLLGAQMIGGVNFLHEAGVEVVRSHHERWDGSGYPDGLVGDEIPIGARIFAVADAVDAITNHRPYREARSWRACRQEIVAEQGQAVRSGRRRRLLRPRARPARDPPGVPGRRVNSRRVDFSLTDDQREIQALTREFAQAEIEPNAAAWDREHRFPTELYPKLAELGLMGVCVPAELGGAGADFLSYILVLEELSRADAGVGVTVAVHTSACTLPILAFGTDEQRERFVPPLARGEKIGAFALTEPEAGLRRRRAAHDRDRRTATAGRSPARSSASPTASRPARSSSSPAPTRRSKARAASRRSSSTREHVEVTREEEKLGLNSSSTADLVIEARAWTATGCCTRRARASRSRWRRSTAAGSGSPRRRSGSRRPPTTSRASTPRSGAPFGKPIGEHQAIQCKLADMSTEIDAARLLVYRAAWLKEQGEPHTEAGAKAKLFASEMATPPDRRGDPDPRRLRLHEGVPGRALLPRREDHRDLRGDERDPAARDRPPDPRAAARAARRRREKPRRAGPADADLHARRRRAARPRSATARASRSSTAGSARSAPSTSSTPRSASSSPATCRSVARAADADPERALRRRRRPLGALGRHRPAAGRAAR